MSSKVCKGCGVEKSLAEFYRHAGLADGHLNKCKACVRARTQKYRREHLEQYAQYEKGRANLPIGSRHAESTRKNTKKKYPSTKSSGQQKMKLA